MELLPLWQREQVAPLEALDLVEAEEPDRERALVQAEVPVPARVPERELELPEVPAQVPELEEARVEARAAALPAAALQRWARRMKPVREVKRT